MIPAPTKVVLCGMLKGTTDPMHTTYPMLKTLTISLALVFATACRDNPRSASSPRIAPTKTVPEISVSTPVHDFGRLPIGNRVTHVFKIKNTGDADLIIENTAST